MFKLGLLTSTAMTAVALLLSGALHEAQAQTAMHVADRDANARFLCTYGEFLVSAFANIDSSQSAVSAWEHVAVPVTGHGQMVHRIRVIEAQDRFTSTSAFSAGIYSNTPSGFPGKLIAGGTGNAPPSCGPVTIPIPPTRLKRRTTYWIEGTIQNPLRCRTSMRIGSADNRRQFRPSACSGTSSSAGVYWEANPNTKRKAYVQTHRSVSCSSPPPPSCHSSSYTSPWTVQSKGPYLKLK
jgi:hypothetical protein